VVEALRTRHYSRVPRRPTSPDSPLPQISRRHATARNGPDGRRPFSDALGSRRKRGRLPAEPALAAVLFLTRPAGTATGTASRESCGPESRSDCRSVDPRRVEAILAQLDGAPRLGCMLLYGSGHEVLEGLGLRVKDRTSAVAKLPSGRARPKGSRHHAAGRPIPTASGPPGRVREQHVAD